jgi:hypothetical protein
MAKCDKEHVHSLIDHVKNNMTDPFDVEACPKDLINIATGLHAKKEVEDSLLNCVDQGQKYLQSFVVGCLKENETNRICQNLFYADLFTHVCKC